MHLFLVKPFAMCTLEAETGLMRLVPCDMHSALSQTGSTKHTDRGQEDTLDLQEKGSEVVLGVVPNHGLKQSSRIRHCARYGTRGVPVETSGHHSTPDAFYSHLSFAYLSVSQMSWTSLLCHGCMVGLPTSCDHYDCAILHDTWCIRSRCAKQTLKGVRAPGCNQAASAQQTLDMWWHRM